MNKKIWVMVGLGIVCIAGLIGCNIFSWTHSAGSGEDATVLLADADSALASGDYAKAMEYYQKAIDADPANSKARYGYVNAYVKNSGLNIIEFAKSAGNQKTIASAVPGLTSNVVSAGGSFLIDDRTKPFGIDMKKFEDLAIVLVDKLDPIATGKCDGKVPATDPEVNLNLAFGYLLRGLFLIFDPPNGNSGSIQYNIYKYDDGTQVIWDYTTNAALPTSASLSQKASALSYLDTAIVRFDTAIANSIAKDSKDWTEVRKALSDIRTEIASYAG